MRIGIDAANFLHDSRGMGRVARMMTAFFLNDPALEVTLLTRRRAADDESLFARMFASERFSLGWAHEAAGAERFDAVWFPWNGIRFRCAAPSLVTMHDVFAFSEPHRNAVARWREQAPVKRAVRCATMIATDSSWSQAQIIAKLGVPPHKVTVIGLAPDRFWYERGGEQLPAALQGIHFVLLVGAGEARKNAPMLLEACRRALRAPNERLVIVGTVSDDLAAALETTSVSNVRVPADDQTLRALYRAATVVAVPSYAEGFGLVAAEAMACGAPVFAANAAALPETARGAAMLLDPHDPAAWAQAIRRIFDAPLLARELSQRSLAAYSAKNSDQPACLTLELLRTIATA